MFENLSKKFDSFSHDMGVKYRIFKYNKFLPFINRVKNDLKGIPNYEFTEDNKLITKKSLVPTIKDVSKGVTLAGEKVLDGISSVVASTKKIGKYYPKFTSKKSSSFDEDFGVELTEFNKDYSKIEETKPDLDLGDFAFVNKNGDVCGETDRDGYLSQETNSIDLTFDMSEVAKDPFQHVSSKYYDIQGGHSLIEDYCTVVGA